MLNIKKMKLSNKLLLGALATIIIACGVVKSANNFNTISYDEKWLTPFESITTTVYDLGDGFTSTVTTTTVNKIISVGHTDDGMYTAEQWDEILRGIENGSIVWED